MDRHACTCILCIGYNAFHRTVCGPGRTGGRGRIYRRCSSDARRGNPLSCANSEIPSGPLESGTRIYLGDKIDVASDACMQILLLDETVFTLGRGARLTIYEFVFNPSTQSGSTTRNDSTIRQYDYKLSNVSPTINYRLTD